jgi:4-amino-4-deoxy-L-arabinose transferase-like glycosyltransferase
MSAPPDRPAPDLPGKGTPRQIAATAGFAVLIAGGLLLNLGTRPLEFEEPRRALVALEMALRGNLLVPTTNGALYLNKPPVFNWVLLACMRVLGSGEEWVLRLPTVASMLLMALVFWRVARRHLPSRTTLTATAFLLTLPTLLFYGTLYAEIDVFYALLVFLQALAVFAFEQRDRPVAMFVVSYLATAVGFLTKGMPSLAFQVLTLGAWLAHVRRWRWLLSWAHLAGLATFALCVGGYFAGYARYADPVPYLARMLFDATERTAAGGEHSVVPILLQLAGFPFQLLSLSAPWSVFAPGLLGGAARARIRSSPFLRFCVVFVVANVAPYWLSPGNRPRYMFMFLPFLAALLAVAMEQLAEQGWYLQGLRWLLGLGLAAAAVGATSLPFTPWGNRVAPLWAWVAVAGSLLVLAIGYWRTHSFRPALGIMLLALAIARVGYDLIVPALRRDSSVEVFYEQVASVLSHEYREEPVLLAGSTSEGQRTIPLAGRTFTFREPEWFSFSLSFHYTEATNEMLRYADDLEPGRLYLAHTAFPVSRPYQVLRIFDYPVGDDQDLKLIRVLDWGSARPDAPRLKPPAGRRDQETGGHRADQHQCPGRVQAGLDPAVLEDHPGRGEGDGERPRPHDPAYAIDEHGDDPAGGEEQRHGKEQPRHQERDAPGGRAGHGDDVVQAHHEVGHGDEEDRLAEGRRAPRLGVALALPAQICPEELVDHPYQHQPAGGRQERHQHEQGGDRGEPDPQGDGAGAPEDDGPAPLAPGQRRCRHPDHDGVVARERDVDDRDVDQAKPGIPVHGAISFGPAWADPASCDVAWGERSTGPTARSRCPEG